MTDVHWTAYLTALMTPVVAVGAILIAYRQWRTAQNKLKLDLFDRRLAVYHQVKQFVRDTLRRDKTNDWDFTFLRETQTAKWLFGPEVDAFLETVVWARAAHLWQLREQAEELEPPERAAGAEARARARHLMVDVLAEMDRVFGPYLKLRH